MSQGLSVSRVVSVSVNFEGILAQQLPIDTALFLGQSTVIDTVQRMREYTSLSAVATDFGTVSPEYLAAVLWFSQSPQPTTLFIGRWVNTASAGQLVGGGIATANQLASAWTGITSGACLVTIDGVPYALTGLNFSSITNLNGVASVLQTAIQAATSSTQTVVYNSTYNRFVITDSTTGTSSVIGFVAPSAAVGSATFSTQPTASDTLTIDGTAVTFVSGTPTGNQVKIGSSLPVTLASLLTFLQSSVDANLSLMTYAVTGSVLYIVSKATGTTGNAYTLAKSSSAIALSGSTLAGGAANDISAMTAMTAASSGAYEAPGLAAETLVTAVATVFDVEFAGQWYGLNTDACTSAADTDREAVTAYCEGANPPHYYGITSSEAGILVASSTTDLFYNLSLLKYNKTAGQYSSSSPYAVCSYLARILTVNWLGNNTTLTLKFKIEPGVAPENLNVNQANALEAKNGNVYVDYDNGTSFIEQGQSFSGQFTDTVVGADWLSGDVQNDIFNELLGALKVPQTDAGMNVLVGAATGACQDAVNNGYVAGGQWNTGGFGTLVQGAYLKTGYYVYAPPVASQSQAIRQTRAAPVIQVAAKLAGAIHSASVILNIEP
jgi:Protein of unknown function (DUF3383)